MRHIAIFLSMTTFILEGCDRQRHINGEVFIVTDGAENIRLGLVEVRVVSQDEIKFCLAEKNREFERLLKLLEPQKAAESKAAEVRNALRVAENALENAEKKVRSQDHLSTSYQTWDAGIKVVYEERRNVQEKREAVDRLPKELPKYPIPTDGPEFYFKDLPAGDLYATTNADGQFLLNVQSRKPITLVAHASRKVAGTIEHYYWVVPVESSLPAQLCILSNNNMNRSLSELTAQIKYSQPDRK